MDENATTNDETSTEPLPTVPVLYLRAQPLRYVAPSVMGLTLLVGVIGNVCLLFVIIRAKGGKTRPVLDVSLISVAVVDLLLLVITGPFFAFEFVTEDWPFGDAACRLLLPFNHLAEKVGAYTVSVLAMDECLMIALPNSYAPRRDLRKSFIVNIVLWFVAVLLTVPVSVFTKSQETAFGASFCTIHMPPLVHGIQLYMILVSFCIPTALTVGCLAWIFYKSNGNFWRPANDDSQPRSKQTRAAVLLIASLITAQALLWLPYHIVAFLQPGIYSSEATRGDFHSYITVACYAYAYSAVKPLLYVFLREDIRHRFVEAVPIGKGNDIRGVRHGRRVSTPIRYPCERGSSKAGRVSSMTSSLRTIHGYPYVVEVDGENGIVMNGLDRRWSL